MNFMSPYFLRVGEGMVNKKIKLLMVFTALANALIGCSGKDSENDEINYLTAPEITVLQETKTHEEDTETNSNYELVNGYEKYLYYDDIYVYIPHIKESEKVRGVRYLYEAYFDITNDVYKSINRPEGTSSVKASGGVGQEKGALLNESLITDKTKDTLDFMKYTTSDVYGSYTDKNVDGDAKVKHYFKKEFDIQGISFALYENFYESIPGIKFSVYGVSNDVWNKYLSGDDVYSNNDYYDMNETLKNNHFSECDLLATKDITQSGVYYINYSKFNNSGKYKNYYIVIEFDDIPYEYAYAFNGDMHYCINDETLYNTWENNNKDRVVTQ